MNIIMIYSLKKNHPVPAVWFDLQPVCVSALVSWNVWPKVRDKRPVVAPDWEDGLLWPHWSKSLTGSPLQSIQREVGNSTAAVWTTAPAISAVCVPLSLFLTYTVFTPPTRFPLDSYTNKYFYFCLALVSRPAVGKQQFFLDLAAVIIGVIQPWRV